METVPVFVVEKFFPPRCPKCERPFASCVDFCEHAGRGSSFVDAKIRQTKLFPELFGVQEEPGVFAVNNRFAVDFISCQHCGNVTLRIQYASRQVMSRDEAEQLVESQGFTCWHEGVAAGNRAKPLSALAPLGVADLAGLKSRVLQAKQLAAKQRGDQARGDTFSSEIDPALVEIVNKVREKKLTEAAGKRLRASFGDLWTGVVPECRDFLLTAEVLKDILVSLTEADPSIDFSPVVAAYSKALERGVLERLFRPFVGSCHAHRLPDPTGKRDHDRSIDALSNFVAGGRDLTLGDMAHCLRNLGWRLRCDERNGFAEFLRATVGDLEAFCEQRKFPGRLIEYVEKFRNKSAHIAKLSKEDCMSARAFLLDEPIRLLLVLEESVGR